MFISVFGNMCPQLCSFFVDGQECSGQLTSISTELVTGLTESTHIREYSTGHAFLTGNVIKYNKKKNPNVFCFLFVFCFFENDDSKKKKSSRCFHEMRAPVMIRHGHPRVFRPLAAAEELRCR